GSDRPRGRASPPAAPLPPPPPLFHRICSVFPSRRSRFSALGRRGPGREQGRESLDQRVVFMALVAASSLVAGPAGAQRAAPDKTPFGPAPPTRPIPLWQLSRLGNLAQGKRMGKVAPGPLDAPAPPSAEDNTAQAA